MQTLGPIQIKLPMALAPMAGVTNAPFRRVCREFAELALQDLQLGTTSPSSETLPEPTGATPRITPGLIAPSGLYVCEMITARALVEGRKTTRALLKPDPQEPVRSVQLHGVDPKTMYRAAQILVESDLADHIDMNFGCPVPKVTRKGGGSALPWKLGHFQKLVRAAVTGAQEAAEHMRRVEVPVSVKVRIGIDQEHQTFLDASAAAADAGAAAVTLHARSANQYYSGQADWKKITELVQSSVLPVWGNGDIFTAEDALHMLEQTGCQGIEVGRGAQGQPWLFYDLACALQGSSLRFRPNLGLVCQVILRHATYLTKWMQSEERALRDMRKHVGWYLRGFPVGGSLRQELTQISTLNQLAGLLATLPSDVPYPAAASGKRGRAGHARKTHLPAGWLETREVDQPAALILKRAELDTTLDQGGY